MHIDRKNEGMKLFLSNVIVLTGASFVVRAMGVVYNMTVGRLIGADGIGRYSLIMSVYGLAVTLAVSGVGLGAVRLTAEAEGLGERGYAKGSIRACFLYALLFGGGSAALLLCTSPVIGRYLLGDPDSIPALAALSLSLPFVSMGSALSGYFTAKRAASISAGMQIFEQTLRILSVATLLRLMLPHGVEYSCLALALGGVVSELGAFLLALILYLRDMRGVAAVREGALASLCRISIPIALASYVRSGLVTVENLLVPLGLARSGAGRERALAAYGELTGMALPVVMLPMAAVSSVASVSLSSLASQLAAGREEQAHATVRRALGFAVFFGVGCAGIMLCFSGELGRVLYNSANAGEYIRMIAPLTPIMYFDHIADALLKALDEQVYSMRVNILDSVMRVILIYTILPRLGVGGYVLVIYISEIVNVSFSVTRLCERIALPRSLLLWIIGALSAVIISTALSRIVFSGGIVVIPSDILEAALHMLFSAALYIGMVAVGRRAVHR